MQMSPRARALFTKSASTSASITTLPLYKDRVIVSHEATTSTSTTIADLAFYDYTNDTDIQYDALPDVATLITNGGFESGALTPFATSGDASWTVTSASKNSGTYSAKAGTIGDYQSTTLTVDAQGGQVSFARSVSSENGYDYLSFYINNILQERWSGTVAWGTAGPYSLSLGTSTLKWVYTKDGSTVGGSDTAWIDDVKVGGTPLTVLNGQELHVWAGKTVEFAETSVFTGNVHVATSSQFVNSTSMELQGNFTNGGAYTRNYAKNWELSYVDPEPEFFDVSYGNGRFVAVSDGSSFWYSDDAYDWRWVTNTGSVWRSVEYGNNRFVVVSDDGDVAEHHRTVSIGHTLLQQRQIPGEVLRTGITLLSLLQRMVLIRVMTSPDGITWTARTAAPNNILAIRHLRQRSLRGGVNRRHRQPCYDF